MSNIQPAADEAAYIRDGQGVSHPLCDLKAREELATKAEKKALEDYAPKDHTHKRFDNDVEIGGSYLFQVKMIKGKKGVQIINADGTAMVHIDSKSNIYIAHGTEGGKTEIGYLDGDKVFQSLASFANGGINIKRKIHNEAGEVLENDLSAENILPKADRKYDLGNASAEGESCRWKNVFAENVDTDDLTLTKGAAYLNKNIKTEGADDAKLTEILAAIWGAIGEGGNGITVDSYLNSSSQNPVQNKAIYTRINSLNKQITSLQSLVNSLSYEIEQLKENGSGSTGGGGGDTPAPDTDTRDYSKCKWTEQGGSETLTSDEYGDKASVVWTPNSDFKLKAGDKINFSVSLDAEQIPGDSSTASSVYIEVKFSNNKYFKETCTYSKGMPVSTVEAGSISLPYTVDAEMSLPTITMTNNAYDYGCNYVQLSSFSINGHSVL